MKNNLIIKMWIYLDKKKAILRTFGSEASEIAQELNERFGSDFLTDFRAMKQGNLQGTESNLYEFVANVDHHLVIRDDWEWWFEHGQHWKYGKPFPVEMLEALCDEDYYIRFVERALTIFQRREELLLNDLYEF